jgi:hypothetical protein
LNAHWGLIVWVRGGAMDGSRAVCHDESWV